MSVYNLLNPTDDQSVLGVKNPSPDATQGIKAADHHKWGHVNPTVSTGLPSSGLDHMTIRAKDMPANQKTR